MKKIKSKLIILAVSFFVATLPGCTLINGSGTSGGSENECTWVDVTKVGFDVDSEVLACFNQVNRFRTSKEAWYWNSDDTTKNNLSGKLEPLELDETLCKAAQVRANELLTNWGHNRPDGTSCFTVLREFDIFTSGRAENIAAGSNSAEQIFLMWKEDDQKHSGQGHRRNMLGNYTKIGIAYVYDPNSQYKYYWAMELIK